MVAADTIAKIGERMSSVRGFGSKTTTIIENIKGHLSTIKGVAEHIDVITTPDWLFEVTDVITDLQDLLEDQNLPTSDADVDSLPKQSTIRSLISLCNLTITPRRLLLQLKQIEKRLQHIAANSSKLSSMKNSTLLSSSSVVKDNGGIEIVGRGHDKDRIIQRILHSMKKVKGAVPAVAISGIRGLGKTTFAKLVCEDDRVKRNFDLVIWIECTHQEFYAEYVVERMIHESATKKDENLNNLGEAMSGRRFFLVLDDLQSENREEWLRLQQILTEAATSSSGGAVLVTTQNSIVAKIVDSDPRALLFELSEKESWTLFEQVASESEIRDTKKKMVNKCKGVPLAILTMARMLRTRDESEQDDNLEEEFMEEMQLIYYNKLHSWHLKQCFAYLAFIFSTTEWVKTKTLIRLWMAEGFLGPVNSDSSSLQQLKVEDFGLDCIKELCRRSILMVRVDGKGNITECSMKNKLMSELSTFVAGKDRFCVDPSDENATVTVCSVTDS